MRRKSFGYYIKGDRRDIDDFQEIRFEQRELVDSVNKQIEYSKTQVEINKLIDAVHSLINKSISKQIDTSNLKNY